MPRRGIKYTHRSDKSWETFLAFCFGQRWWTKGARHSRLSIQIGGRILPLKIFIADPFPPLFSSGPRMRATFFLLLCFAETGRARIGSSNAISAINHFDSSKIPRVRGQKTKPETLRRPLLPPTLNNSARLALSVPADNYFDKSSGRFIIDRTAEASALRVDRSWKTPIPIPIPRNSIQGITSSWESSVPPREN